MNLPWTYSGLPTINIPSGFNKHGLPMGLQVTSQWYTDEHLVSWAGDIEEALTIVTS